MDVAQGLVVMPMLAMRLRAMIVVMLVLVVVLVPMVMLGLMSERMAHPTGHLRDPLTDRPRRLLYRFTASRHHDSAKIQQLLGNTRPAADMRYNDVRC